MRSISGSSSPASEIALCEMKSIAAKLDDPLAPTPSLKTAVGMLERASISFASSLGLTASRIDSRRGQLIHQHVGGGFRLRACGHQSRVEGVPPTSDQIQRQLVAEIRREPLDPRAR